jgi:F-type H+-transporting ATPase subunit b
MLRLPGTRGYKFQTLPAALFLMAGLILVTHAARGEQGAPVSQPAATSGASSDPSLAATEQEDEDAVYKKSGVVRAIGRALHLSPEGASALFEDFNFLILAGAILFYGGRALPKFFRGRQQKIDQQLQEARVATEEANERLLAVEARLGRLDHEIEELRARAERDGVADEQRIKASIEEERKKIVAASEHEITAMATAAERSLRTFAAELAVARASARLQLTDKDDRVLIHDFAAGIAANTDRDLQGRRN